KNTVEALIAATGGRRMGFETQSKLENDLIRLGSEIHNRYILTFTPDQEQPRAFHRVQVTIRNHSDAKVRARPGYWTGLPASQ
ncbi:MAG: hypothetical protein WB992_02595, partial [Bryobacteraceae bacterium]